MRYLSLAEVLVLHRLVLDQSGGATGLRDLGALESAVGQPRQSFGGVDLYTDLPSKAAALGFSLIQSHPFVDGNKRTGHAAMEVFLILNSYEIEAPLEEQEKIVLQIASGELGREEFAVWLHDHLVQV